MQQFHIKQPKLRSFSNFSFSASLSKWLMLFVCCCLFIYNWFISMNWGNNWLELTSYRILSCKVHIILVYAHLSIIFQESVKLSSPNTNKKWLSSMTFPHVTANAMSQAPDAIKCSCFSFVLWLSYFAKVSTKVHNYSGDFRESSCSSFKVSGQFKFCSSLNLINPFAPNAPFTVF